MSSHSPYCVAFRLDERYTNSQVAKGRILCAWQSGQKMLCIFQGLATSASLGLEMISMSLMVLFSIA